MGTSRGNVVLVRESAGELLSADLMLGDIDRRWPGALREYELAQDAVRPGCVVVQQVLGQHLADPDGSH
jgi:hypothetical protein